MDPISYGVAAKQKQRIEKVIAEPDSDSGIVTTPSTIAVGETITIPAGRTAVLPNTTVNGTLVVDGEVFIPSGSSFSKVVETEGNQSIDGVKTFTSSPIVPNATTVGQVVNKGQLDTKQDTLISGTNIKTINSNSLLGGGDIVITSSTPQVRQTVLSGPVDINGFSNFGGSTGSSTVTVSGTLVVTCADGKNDRIGTIVNPSWTGLSTNGTMYLYLDIATNGICTTGSTSLAPTYRWGGADVVTNLQNTFNIQEMRMKVGNGSTASQVYRVFVGEVTVAGAVVTAITWYSLMGRYTSLPQTILTAGSSLSLNHNIGVTPLCVNGVLVNQVADAGYSIGDEVTNIALRSISPYYVELSETLTKNNYVLTSQSGTASYTIAHKITGAVNTAFTNASWKHKVYLSRGW